MNKKEKYDLILNKTFYAHHPTRTEVATIHLNFNKHLVEDIDGQFSVYYSKYFNTELAEEITSGDTWETPSATFKCLVPESGESISFVGIGFYVACYALTESFITPGKNEVHIIAPKEIHL